MRRRGFVFLRAARQELKGVARAGELFRQNGVDTALPLDAILPGKACSHDFEAKMGLRPRLRTDVVVAGMKIRIIINC